MEVLRVAVVLVLAMVLSSPYFENRLVRADDEAVLCKMTQEGLEACKPAVSTGMSNPTDPSKECCAALAGANLPCLCSYRHSFLLPSLGIDPDLAMKLPAKCNLTMPPDC